AAAEKFESRNMVMSFRVSDLQMLLGFVGRSKSGLKHELVTRALQLVQFDCSPELFKKIKELYETRYAKKSAEPGPQPHRPLDPLTMHSAYDRASTVPRTPLSGPNIDYPVLYGKYLNGLGRLPTKTLKPEVRLVKLPFFNMLDELLKPTELVPQNSEKLQESPCIFALTPRQVELIRNSRELQPGVKAVQVVLRICYSDASCPQEDQYPPNIAVKVNHSYCSVPGYYPSNKPGVEPKRPCRPINLTHLMYLSSATNRITVTWGNYGKSYSVALYLVRQLTSAELLQRLRTIGVKHPELCKALVKEKLRLDPDSEIATTGVRVSLICPVSGWQVPALLPPRAAWPGHPPSPQVALVQLVWERRRAGPGWGPLGSSCEVTVGGGPGAASAVVSTASARYIQPARAVGAGLVLVLVLVLKVLLLAVAPGVGGAGRSGGAGGRGGPRGRGLGAAPHAGFAASARGDAVAAVLLEVPVQVVGAHEGLAAAVALVGPQPRVHAHVVLEVVVVREGGAALLAQVGLLPRVLPHVHLELVLPAGGRAAGQVSSRSHPPPARPPAGKAGHTRGMPSSQVGTRPPS
uniref:E3 SUMO-protein ligase PIAS4 n=1 Tax=Marmota marmota marmota TaxID=9994 RepID=A0A8C5ZTC9_MARMA